MGPQLRSELHIICYNTLQIEWDFVQRAGGYSLYETNSILCLCTVHIAIML